MSSLIWLVAIDIHCRSYSDMKTENSKLYNREVGILLKRESMNPMAYPKNYKYVMNDSALSI